MKKTVYLLPGLLCDRSLWRHQLEVLSSDYDLRVADFSVGDSMGTYADNILAQAPEKFSVAGLSMGAYVALEIMRKAPERVERLALLDASPYADLQEHREFREGSMAMARERGIGDVIDAVLPRLVHPSRYEDEELVKVIDAMAHRVGVEGFLKQQTALLNRDDYYNDLASVTCPVLVAVGRQDGMTPPRISREIVEAMPSAALVEIENCGHLSTLEQPEAVTALLRYWLQR